MKMQQLAEFEDQIAEREAIENARSKQMIKRWALGALSRHAWSTSARDSNWYILVTAVALSWIFIKLLSIFLDNRAVGFALLPAGKPAGSSVA